MQAAYTEDSRNKSTAFNLLGTVRPSTTVHLITNNTSLIAPINTNGSGLDTCSFYAGPTDSTIIAFGESSEACGSIAYSAGESCGSVAYSGGGESCGSVASSTSSSVSCGCSYSC